VIDYTRSRILYRAARKYNSQRSKRMRSFLDRHLVIECGDPRPRWRVTGRSIPGLGWMSEADAVAAMAVALIVIFISGEWAGAPSMLCLTPRPKHDGKIRPMLER